MSDLPYIRQGTTFGQTSARQWRNLSESADAFNQLSVGQGLTLTRVPGWTHIGLVADPTVTQEQVASEGVGFFHVLEVLADTLRCRTWDGEVEGTEDVYVLRPYLHRQTLFQPQGDVYPDAWVIRNGIWYDYSGWDVDGHTGEHLGTERMYEPDRMTRLAMRFGDGRDSFQRVYIEKLVERLDPIYYTIAGAPEGDTADGPDEIVALELAEPGGPDGTATYIERNVSGRRYIAWCKHTAPDLDDL